MKSKTLLVQAALAFKAKDFKKSGVLFASAMNQADSDHLLAQLQQTTESNTELTTESNTVGFNNTLFEDRDLPLGDNRYAFQDRLADKYPVKPMVYFDPNNEPIKLLDGMEGSMMPTSGGQLVDDTETDVEIDEELDEDPTVCPSSISKTLYTGLDDPANEDFDSVSNIGASSRKPQKKIKRQTPKFEKVVFD